MGGADGAGAGKLAALSPHRWGLVEALCARSLALLTAREALSHEGAPIALGGVERPLLIES